ncbi:MAG: RNA pseudouridine synthase [Bacteroidetes bacterium B1(2017)]|nr:MAG: RNA pseudouridine synthase [Bacteroidetes bacterium B1(2017)]
MVKILFEDNHLIAAFKQSGQTVQPEPNKPIALEDEVKAYIKTKYNKEGAVFLGVIHRLDMPVSGLVLFARTSKALARMNEKFHDREVNKEYEAWVENKPPMADGMLIHYLKRDENKNFTKAFSSEVKDSLKAQLGYKVIKNIGSKYLLRIKLYTGRKHQIRAQLSAMGCPIVGDYKYGASAPLKNGVILLQSCELSFIHPVKEEPVSIQTEGLGKFF